MFDLWYGLPPLLRAGLGLLLIGLAVLIYIASGGTRATVGLGATGLVFLLFCSAGSSKDGYNF